ESFENAVGQAVERASDTLRNIGWFEVKELRGLVKEGKVEEFQVKVSIGFRLE
ncbi:MAG: dodecin domain-containing protein, partial [Armatimonadetes bacterium]|nr:dodecin domain-containing protein [Armatimonadota bacterium]